MLITPHDIGGRTSLGVVMLITPHAMGWRTSLGVVFPCNALFIFACRPLVHALVQLI